MKRSLEIVAGLGGYERIGFEAEDLVELLKKDWEAARPELVRASGECEVSARQVNATLLLLVAGDEAFADGSRRVLAPGADPELQLMFINNVLFADGYPGHLGGVLNGAGLGDDLEALCEVAGDEVLDRGALLLGKVDDERARRLSIREFDREGEGTGRKLVLGLALGMRDADENHPGVFETITAQVEEKGADVIDWRAWSVLKRYLQSDDGAVAAAAEAFFAPYLESNVGAWAPHDRQALLLAFLAGAQSQDSLAAVEAIENAPVAAGDTVVQGYALEARYRLGGGKSLKELEQKLGEPALALYAARALVAASPEVSDRLLDQLFEGSGRCYGSDQENFLKLIRDCGHPLAVERLRAHLQATFPGMLPTILGKADGWTTARFAEVAVDCGLLASAPTAEELAEAEEMCTDAENAEFLAICVLIVCGRLFEFDIEADEVPPPYEEWIEDIAKISGGEFSPAEIAVEAVGEDGACSIRFRCGARDYEVRTEDSGDYYDVGPVMAEINKALEDAGADGRYASAGDAGQIVFGTPESIAAFSRRTGIVFQLGKDRPDGEDPDDAVPEEPASGFLGRLKRWFS